MLTQQNNSLRFDIYERVHLGEDHTSIKGLDEVELVPHIQIVTQDDQAILKGNLLLACTYDGEEAAGQQVLEHRIPVEISLPLNRIHRVDDITVEIENLDIELMSARSINVTGILSLQGILLPEQADHAAWNEEEITFVHQVQASEPKDVQEQVQLEESSRDFTQNTIDPLGDEAFNSSLSTEQQTVSSFQSEGMQNEDRSAVDDLLEQAAVMSAAEGSHWGEESETTSRSEGSAQIQMSEASENVVVSADQRTRIAEEAVISESLTSDSEDKNELKIAFGTKKEEESKSSVRPLASLVARSESPQLQADNEVQNEAISDDAESDIDRQGQSGEETEWKNLLSNPSEENQFRKVRICIVQKDETLENIAKRYSLNPREIALHNRLMDSEVSVGQIIYIPVS